MPFSVELSLESSIQLCASSFIIRVQCITPAFIPSPSLSPTENTKQKEEAMPASSYIPSPSWASPPSFPFSSSFKRSLLPSLSPLHSPITRFYACDSPPSQVTADALSSASADTTSSPPKPSHPSFQTPSQSPHLIPSPHPSAPSPFMPTPIPGPTPLPVVGNALDILELPLSELMLKYARLYGPFLTFSILNDRLYLVSDPHALSHINVTNSKNYLDRWTPPGFEILLYDRNLRGLVFSQRRYWAHHRQLVGSVFRSSTFLSNFVTVVREKTRFLINNCWSSQTRPVNVHQAMRMLTLDVIGSAAFGHEFGAMAAGHHPIETALSHILSSVLDVIKFPVPLWRVMHTPGRAKIQASLNRLQQIELRLITDRRARLTADPQANQDLLAQLLRARESNRGVHFTDDDLVWDVHDVIFAGHETTSSALAAAIFLVAGSPRVLRCIQEELDAVLPGGREPQVEDLPKLRYLDMVLNEALRLYPPTALLGRLAKKKDIICGYEVPSGANVLMSPYIMGRLETLWDNPEEFRPERFLPDQIAKRHPMCHTPFGSGPRVCLGVRMATMEAKLVLAMIFSRFSFERTSDQLEVDYNSTVSFKNGMDMRLVERSLTM